MALKLFNTFGKKKELFRPLEPEVVKMYTCGPTVYDFAHIGNFRAYLFADLLRRYLEFKGYKVEQVINITDVGHLRSEDAESGPDKVSAKAKEEKKTPLAIANFYMEAFLVDAAELRIANPLHLARATEHIPEMIALIERLIKKGVAYEVAGEVYFDVKKFPRYGELSGNTLELLKAGARVKVNPAKRSPHDFTLWRKAEPDHLMQWGSPWGKGYPGWHIECSAMSMKYLGEQIDIHTGGEDNIFPHHEDEIAQSESATGKKFVRFWLHTAPLTVEGKKMAKSAGNFITVDEIKKRGYAPILYRYLALSTHYRNRLDFRWKSLSQVEEGLERVIDFKKRLKGVVKEAVQASAHGLALGARERFMAAMDDDLNTPEALAAVFEMIRRGNKRIDQGILSSDEAGSILEFLAEFEKIFKVLDVFAAGQRLSMEEKTEVNNLVQERDQARREGDWDKADLIREKLYQLGFEVRDTDAGTEIKERQS